MENCILESPANLGGDVHVGSRSLFEVIVAGTGVESGGWGVIGLNRSDVAVEGEKVDTGWRIE